MSVKVKKIKEKVQKPKKTFLNKKIFELQALIRKIKFGGKFKEKNVKKIKELKKEIARLKTKGF